MELIVKYFIIYFRKDEHDGLGQTVLVLPPKNYVPNGQYSACGAEHDTGVSALSHTITCINKGREMFGVIYPETNSRFT